MHSYVDLSQPNLKRAKSAKSIKDTFPPRMFQIAIPRSRRRRIQSVSMHAPPPVSTLSDLEFNISGLLDSSDLDSLPDLTDTASCVSPLSAVTPTFQFPGETDLPTRQGFFPEKPSIFNIPELVHKIIEFVDAQNSMVPRERSPQRRKALLTNNTMIVHENTSSEEKRAPGAMHACLLVNRLFYRITKQVMNTKLFFSNERSFYKFVRNDDPAFFADFRPSTLVLNKLFCAKQTAMDKIAHTIDYSQLEWLEIYMCPKLLPSETFLHLSLRSLIITGSKILDDSLLVEVARRCPNLQVVDLRACEGITDYGVYAVATSCSKLTSINLGRKKRGHLITDHSVSTLVCNNKRLETVGLAGCYITDRTIWELAMNCGFALERLSLNNCPYVTNHSIPTILHHNLLPNLAVLEMRFLTKITNLEPIVSFRRQQGSKGICMLLEICDELMERLRDCETRMDNYISENIFQDITEWVNSKDDEEPALVQSTLHTQHADL